MTVKEYIASIFQGITIPEAFYADMDVDLEEDYDPSMFHTVGAAMTNALAGIILAPRVKQVNENGFSMAWDTDTLGRYYLWLCKRYGITPDGEILSLIGTSSIVEITDRW